MRVYVHLRVNYFIYMPYRALYSLENRYFSVSNKTSITLQNRGWTYPLYVEVWQRRVDGTLAEAGADDGLDDGAEQYTVYPGRSQPRAPHGTVGTGA